MAKELKKYLEPEMTIRNINFNDILTASNDPDNFEGGVGDQYQEAP